MQLASVCGILIILQVSQAGTPPQKVLKPLHKTFPIQQPPLNFTPEEMKQLTEEQTPDIDGPTTGTKNPPSDAGKVSQISKLIVGGIVSTRGQFPWQAGIIVNEVYFCGGSLITSYHILTAGHCTKPFTTFSVLLGSQDKTVYEEGRVTLDTTKKIVHEKYNENNLRNDIAILVLPVAVASSAIIKTIRLPTKKHAKMTFAKKIASVSGWGKVSDESLDVSAVMNNVQLEVIPNTECVKNYSKTYVQKTNICAWGKQIKATCGGDSGGPLVLKESDDSWIQLGIVSFGSSAGCTASPSVFTRVSAYLSWISKNINIKILNS